MLKEYIKTLQEKRDELRTLQQSIEQSGNALANNDQLDSILAFYANKFPT